MRVWREATLPFAPSSLCFFASDGRPTPRLLAPLGAHFLHCFCGLRKFRLACRVLKDLPLFWEGVVAVQSSSLAACPIEPQGFFEDLFDLLNPRLLILNVGQDALRIPQAARGFYADFCFVTVAHSCAPS